MRRPLCRVSSVAGAPIQLLLYHVIFQDIVKFIEARRPRNERQKERERAGRRRKLRPRRPLLKLKFLKPVTLMMTQLCGLKMTMMTECWILNFNCRVERKPADDRTKILRTSWRWEHGLGTVVFRCHLQGALYNREEWTNDGQIYSYSFIPTLFFIVTEGHHGFAGKQSALMNYLFTPCDVRRNQLARRHPIHHVWTSFIPSIAKPMIASPDCMHQFPEWLRGGQLFSGTSWITQSPEVFATCASIYHSFL